MTKELPGLTRNQPPDAQTAQMLNRQGTKIMSSHHSDLQAQVMQSHQSFMSTQSEPDLMRSFETVPHV